MEYSFPTPAIRRAVREASASFSDADDSTPEFGVKLPLQYVGGRVLSSNTIIETAQSDDYALVGGSFVLSREYPADSEYAGEKYEGHLDLQFEPMDWVDTDDQRTTADVLADIEELAANTKEYDDYTQFRIDVPNATEELDFSKPLRLLQESGEYIEDVTATEEEHSDTSHVFIRVAFDEPDPYEMGGINKREEMTIRRHEALTLVQALDQYDGDQTPTNLRDKLVTTHNLERYLQHLD